MIQQFENEFEIRSFNDVLQIFDMAISQKSSLTLAIQKCETSSPMMITFHSNNHS